MKEGFQTVATLIESKQFAKLKTDFVSCNDISSPNDTSQFVEDLAGVFTNVVQYNDETAWMDIRKVCGYMTNTYKSSYDRLRDVNDVSITKLYLHFMHFIIFQAFQCEALKCHSRLYWVQGLSFSISVDY